MEGTIRHLCKERNIFNRLYNFALGYEVCPMCGKKTKPHKVDGYWVMGCQDINCPSHLGFMTDMYDTKKQCKSAYRKIINQFLLVCNYTCKCSKCGGEVVVVDENFDENNKFSVRCMGCNQHFEGISIVNCVKAWNDANKWSSDPKFILRIAQCQTPYAFILNDEIAKNTFTQNGRDC